MTMIFLHLAWIAPLTPACSSNSSFTDNLLKDIMLKIPELYNTLVDSKQALSMNYDAAELSLLLI